MPLVSTLRKVGALLSKELLVEYRTKAGLMSFIQFSFISLFLVSMSMNAVSSSMGLETLSALFWIIIFFTTLATLDKAFVQERERGTLLALQLYTLTVLFSIGQQVVFSLGRRSSLLHTGFHVSGATLVPSVRLIISPTGPLPSAVQLSSCIRL